MMADDIRHQARVKFRDARWYRLVNDFFDLKFLEK